MRYLLEFIRGLFFGEDIEVLPKWELKPCYRVTYPSYWTQEQIDRFERVDR